MARGLAAGRSGGCGERGVGSGGVRWGVGGIWRVFFFYIPFLGGLGGGFGECFRCLGADSRGKKQLTHDEATFRVLLFPVCVTIVFCPVPPVEQSLSNDERGTQWVEQIIVWWVL